jgi:hypothetical protein
MKSFIKVIELWLPAPDGSMLEFGGGLFGGAANFEAISRTMCFGRGEGLPGRAWDEGRPIVLPRLEGSYFQRTAAARAAGLACGLALPVFVEGALTAVLVFFCGSDPEQAGAIELWRNDARVSSDMTLVDGYYSAGASALAVISHDAYLPRGSGLPGLAWQRGSTVLMDDLMQSPQFLRSDSAAQAGVRRGLALPCSTPGDSGTTYVMSLLSAPQTPIAERIECWAPDGEQRQLQRAWAFCEEAGRLPADAAAIDLESEPGVIGMAFRSGVPGITQVLAADPAGAQAAAAGLRALCALPVVSDGRVVEVVVLYF